MNQDSKIDVVIDELSGVLRQIIKSRQLESDEFCEASGFDSDPIDEEFLNSLRIYRISGERCAVYRPLAEGLTVDNGYCVTFASGDGDIVEALFTVCVSYALVVPALCLVAGPGGLCVVPLYGKPRHVFNNAPVSRL